MYVSEMGYNRLASAVGLLLTLMGLGLLGMYGVFMATGTNPIDAGLPGLGAIGQMLFASVGAFALPLGASLLRGGPEASGRLRIAGAALGLMSVVRLLAFTNMEIRSAVGACRWSSSLCSGPSRWSLCWFVHVPCANS